MFKKISIEIISKSYLIDKINKFDKKFNRDENAEFVVVEIFVFSIVEKFQQMFETKKIQIVDILNQQIVKTANRRDESIRLISQSSISRFGISKKVFDSTTIENNIFFFKMSFY